MIAAPKVSRKAVNTMIILSASGIPSSKPTPAMNHAIKSAKYAQGIDTSRATQRIKMTCHLFLELTSDITASFIHYKKEQELIPKPFGQKPGTKPSLIIALP
jgi:hypothetical protein